MKYLLIDFGASFVKSASFDDSDNKIRNYAEIQSPFLDADSLQLSNLKNILDSRGPTGLKRLRTSVTDCGKKIASQMEYDMYTYKIKQITKTGTKFFFTVLTLPLLMEK